MSPHRATVPSTPPMSSITLVPVSSLKVDTKTRAVVPRRTTAMRAFRVPMVPARSRFMGCAASCLVSGISIVPNVFALTGEGTYPRCPACGGALGKAQGKIAKKCLLSVDYCE